MICRDKTAAAMKKALLTAAAAALILAAGAACAAGAPIAGGASAEDINETNNENTVKEYEEPMKYTVACVGDSLTFGMGAQDPVAESYPAVLASLDGKYKFETEKYGHSGATVDYVGWLPFAGTEEYADSLKTQADIVLLMLGTNDTVFSQNRDIFPENFEKMVSTYVGLPCKPKVIVMLPPHFFNDGPMLQASIANLETVIEQEKQVAAKLGLDTIDVYSLTEGRSDLSPDGVHFTAEGYKVLARFVYDELGKILDGAK